MSAFKPKLDEVTIVAVSSVALDATARALTLSCEAVDFARALLISDRLPPGGLPANIEWCQVAPLKSRHDYSAFLFRELVSCVETSHVLIVQWDGYVINPGEWDPAFLQYDYIGAPWPHYRDFTVGNGGFSLRSRKLLEALAEETLLDGEQEDRAICRRIRPKLESELGLRFASREVAAQFAFERTERTGREFGFHGVFNMPDLLGIKMFMRVMEGIEPNLVHRNERREILARLWRRGAMVSSLRLAHRFRRPSL
ncbi:MAG: hypothetical protein KGM83_11195 [Betaproteobacteria bacterium]|nr:hypothetical protein [Betaproteobacteria bacterium]